MQAGCEAYAHIIHYMPVHHDWPPGGCVTAALHLSDILQIAWWVSGTTSQRMSHLCAVNKAAGREHRQELRGCIVTAELGRVICDRHIRPLQVRRRLSLKFERRCAALLLA